MRPFSFATLAALGFLVATPLVAQTAAPATKPASPAASPAAALVDINSASKDELDKLSGIGGVRAEAIVKGRPYKGKDELVAKKIIPQNVYDGIKDRIVARQK